MVSVLLNFFFMLNNLLVRTLKRMNILNRLFLIHRELKYFQYSTHNLTLCVHINAYIFMLIQHTHYAGKWPTVSPPDWSHSFAFGVCGLLTLPIALPSHSKCVNVCAWWTETESRRENWWARASLCVHICLSTSHISMCVGVACLCVRQRPLDGDLISLWYDGHHNDLSKSTDWEHKNELIVGMSRTAYPLCKQMPVIR